MVLLCYGVMCYGVMCYGVMCYVQWKPMGANGGQWGQVVPKNGPPKCVFFATLLYNVPVPVVSRCPPKCVFFANLLYNVPGPLDRVVGPQSLPLLYNVLVGPQVREI